SKDSVASGLEKPRLREIPLRPADAVFELRLSSAGQKFGELIWRQLKSPRKGLEEVSVAMLATVGDILQHREHQSLKIWNTHQRETSPSTWTRRSTSAFVRFSVTAMSRQSSSPA